MRKLTRRPTPAQMARSTMAFIEAHAQGPRVDELRASAERYPVPERRKVQQMPDNPSATDMDAVHKRRDLEGPVVKAVWDLLAVHPRVLWALRMNSGAASYEAATGKYAPVWFHRWVKPRECRMSDFLGAVIHELRPAILAIECKLPGWTKPTDLREREQANFLQIVRDNGGIALFATDAEQVKRALDG